MQEVNEILLYRKGTAEEEENEILLFGRILDQLESIVV